MFNRCAIFVIAGLAAWMPAQAQTSRPDECPPEDFQELSLPETDWLVIAKVWSCGPLDSGRMEVIAKRKNSEEIVEIAKFGYPAPIKLSTGDSRRLIIELPNLVDMTDTKTEFYDVSVSYRFLPYDDPQARANYQLWLHHPDDPHAVEWHHNEIESKEDPRLRGP